MYNANDNMHNYAHAAFYRFITTIDFVQQFNGDL